MANVFDRIIGRSQEEKVKADGSRWVRAVAHAALTAKRPYGIYQAYDGWRTAALSSVHTEASDSVHFFRPVWKIAVPEVAAVTNDEVWMQVGGYCSATLATATTLAAGEYVEISGGSIVLGAATSTVPINNTFAVAYSATTSTSVELFLLNQFVIGKA